MAAVVVVAVVAVAVRRKRARPAWKALTAAQPTPRPQQRQPPMVMLPAHLKRVAARKTVVAVAAVTAIVVASVATVLSKAKAAGKSLVQSQHPLIPASNLRCP